MDSTHDQCLLLSRLAINLMRNRSEVNLSKVIICDQILFIKHHKLEYAAPIWSPYSKLQINRVEKVQRTAARWTCRRWRNTSSVGEMLGWPSLEASRDRSSLLLFHKIYSGVVSIKKRQVPDPCLFSLLSINYMRLS